MRIQGPGLSKGFSQNPGRICKSKSSNAPIGQKGSSFCRDVGLSNALSLGLIAAAGWPRISKSSPETRSLFLHLRLDSSHAQKALSELMNFSGPTLRRDRYFYPIAQLCYYCNWQRQSDQVFMKICSPDYCVPSRIPRDGSCFRGRSSPRPSEGLSNRFQRRRLLCRREAVNAPRKVALGQNALFRTTQISESHEYSCSTCHEY